MGVPYGPALIKYDDPNKESLSFKGLGVFDNGKLHFTTFTFIRGDGFKY